MFWYGFFLTFNWNLSFNNYIYCVFNNQKKKEILNKRSQKFFKFKQMFYSKWFESERMKLFLHFALWKRDLDKYFIEVQLFDWKRNYLEKKGKILKIRFCFRRILEYFIKRWNVREKFGKPLFIWNVGVRLIL